MTSIPPTIPIQIGDIHPVEATVLILDTVRTGSSFFPALMEIASKAIPTKGQYDKDPTRNKFVIEVCRMIGTSRAVHPEPLDWPVYDALDEALDSLLGALVTDPSLTLGEIYLRHVKEPTTFELMVHALLVDFRQKVPHTWGEVGG